MSITTSGVQGDRRLLRIVARVADAYSCASRPRRLLRPGSALPTRSRVLVAFGDRNDHTIAVVNSAGYVPVRWTVDTLGWKGTTLGGITPQIVVDRVVAAVRPGEIVLMHVGSNPDDHTTLDADTLPSITARLQDLVYAFVKFDALLALP